ncbi:LPS assembly protein LptD [Temperatibacter marinus]|uniref:LPS-assembly protein LptD n=1 Tax=Temperatibacter marinus TaxID=1456591 RepID=A0AA52ECP3_9PROT|nr:LPS assembly protein LptD [Temperatibacter marinus]WND02341.1 LPS assembly protein LptD [Temperatibacter marinus]
MSCVSMKKLLLKGTILSSLCVMSGLASTPISAQETKVVEFEADQLSHDDKTGEVLALGRVKLNRKGYTLEAGQIRYNPKTGKAVATGAVKMTDPDGNVIWSDRIELENDLRDAFVKDIRLLLKDGAQVAANSAVRDEDTGKITLNRAVYSPCEVCEQSGEEPLWQLKAVKVVHDKGKRRLYYDNAYLEVLGLPLMWLPKFSHPDPTVDRANGFLPIEFSSNKQLGLIVGLPYYHSFSKSRDATITPLLTTKEGLVLKGEYRQHVGYGRYEVVGSLTYTDKRDEFNVDTGANEFRGHLFSHGYLDHNKNWRSSYEINWASDDTYLRRYDFSDDDTLMSDFTVEGFYDQSYLTARTIAFQGLRIEDNSGLTGHALPLIQGEYVTNNTPLGGTLSLSADGLILHQPDWVDTKRLSAQAEWKNKEIFNSGLVLETTLLLRGDLYEYRYENNADLNFFPEPEEDTSFSRGLFLASNTLSFPLIKVTADAQHRLEPLVDITYTPQREQSQSQFNFDSQAFELDQYTLFSPDRFAGYDLWDDTSRFTYGLSYAFHSDSLTFETLIGQSYAINNPSADLTVNTGLEDNFSDWVTAQTLSYKNHFTLHQQLRLDSDDLSIKRHLVDVGYEDTKTAINVSYFKSKEERWQLYRENREELRVSGRVQLKNKLWLSSSLVQDLTKGWDGVEYGAGIEFLDDCLSISLQYRKNYTRDRDIEPGNSIIFRIKLLNLG